MISKFRKFFKFSWILFALSELSVHAFHLWFDQVQLLNKSFCFWKAVFFCFFSPPIKEVMVILELDREFCFHKCKIRSIRLEQYAILKNVRKTKNYMMVGFYWRVGISLISLARTQKWSSGCNCNLLCSQRRY